MKSLFTAGKLFISALALLFTSQMAVAQGDFDVTRFTVDPNTNAFSDGKHLLPSYILSQLETKTNCCGLDDIYLEIKYDASGRVTSTRVINSNNECNRRSLPEIIQYIRFDVPDPNNIRPKYLGMRPSIECKGSAQDNQYKAIAAPAGWNPNAAPLAQAQPKPQTTPAAQQPVAATPTPAAQPQTPATSARPQQASTLPKDSLQALVRKTELPKPTYKPRDLTPTKENFGNHQNVSGPSASVGLGVSSTKAALFVKKSMREAGICGLAQVLAELELQPDGTVTGVRFLRTNNDDVKSAALRILASMNFTTTSNFVTYPIFEFKTIIDCTGAGISQEINSVPNYFYGPNDQDLLQKQRQQQGTQPGGAIQLPTDR